MKLLYYALLGAMSLGVDLGHAAPPAQATAFCYSLRFQRGLDPQGNYYLDLTSLSGSVNGELAPDFLASGYTHSTYLSLTDELLGETLSGALALDVPDAGDANQDGFADFFQVSQGVTNLASSGAYDLALYGNGGLTAVWNRPAGSKDGNCVLSLKLMPFQPVAFSFGFEILEYKGALSYTASPTNVAASLTLAQTAGGGGTMGGAAQFAKSATDRFNSLTLQSGAWTNELQQALDFTPHLFSRDLQWPTNYYGYLEFTDTNYPGAFYPYGLWMLSIDDLNDSNQNGIPDFSDDPLAGGLPRRPWLELQQNGGDLLITLHGDVGRMHEIQTIADLGSADWHSAVPMMLTNDPQNVPVPLPSGGAGFWRVRAQ